MADNVTQAVASGNSPQPQTGNTESTNLDADSIADEIVGSDSPSDSGASAEAKAIDAAAAKGQITQAEAKSMKKRLTLKVDGREEIVDFDPSDEAALIRELQKSRAFDSRSKEFSGFKNQVDAFINELRSNPGAALEKLGMNVDELAEKRIQQRIEDMQKSPEQLEREKMQKELEELKAEKKRAEQEREQAQQEALKNKYAGEIESEIESELSNAKSKLPRKNPRVVARIAQTMLLASQNGYPNVTVKDVIPYVEKEWQEELRSYFDPATEDLLEEMVGKQNIERMRKRRLAKRPTTQTANQIKDSGTQKTKEDLEDKPKTKRMKDFFRYD
jgi:hypothetical protein